jgi:hypothetical protein
LLDEFFRLLAEGVIVAHSSRKRGGEMSNEIYLGILHFEVLMRELV